MSKVIYKVSRTYKVEEWETHDLYVTEDIVNEYVNQYDRQPADAEEFFAWLETYYVDEDYHCDGDRTVVEGTTTFTLTKEGEENE